MYRSVMAARPPAGTSTVTSVRTPTATSAATQMMITSRGDEDSGPAGRICSVIAIARTAVAASDTMAARKNGRGPASTTRSTQASSTRAGVPGARAGGGSSTITVGGPTSAAAAC